MFKIGTHAASVAPAIRLMLPLAVALCLSAAAEDRVRYDDHAVVRVEVDSMRTLRTVLAIGGDIWSESIGIGMVDVMVPTDRLAVLERSGLRHEILIDAVQPLLDAEHTRLEAAGEGGIAGAGFFDDYRTRTDLLDFYDALAAARPDLVTSRVIGTSIEGRPIRAFTICGGDPATLPAIYVNTGAHAREWIGPATIAFVADALVNGHGADPRITTLVDGLCWHIVPLANPDGYEHTWSVNRLWRKTRRDNGDGTFGVDWNRNFAAGWGGPGSSGATNNDTYRGTAPFSEPETQATRDDVLSLPNVAVFLDVHSYSQLVLWPYGYSTSEPAGPAGEIHRTIGTGIADAIRSVHGSVFTPQPAHALYLASGTSPDWAWDDAGVIGFTYELRDTGQFGFILPPDQIVPSGEEILESLLWTGEQVIGAVEATFPTGEPTFVLPDVATEFNVALTSIFATIDPSTAACRTRVDGGPWSAAAMPLLGDDQYRATLPAVPCGSTIEFEFRVSTVEGAEIVVQADTGDAWSAIAIETTVAFEDDAETDLGWSLADATDTATTGRWVRVDPNGTAAQPEDDATPDPGRFCFVTGQGSVGGGLGEADIDGGVTTLTSPEIAIDGLAAITISCRVWYSNDTGASPNEDSMPVEARLDDGAWFTLETVAVSDAAWRALEWSVPTGGASTLQIRFVASDLGSGSVVEAGVDEIRVFAAGCADAPCVGDLDGDGQVDGADVGLLLAAWGSTDPSADLTGDGFVNGADLGLLLGGWGLCP